jgi:HPt (histidine-containing phosphotransfer) domain-containing protein
MGFNVYLQTFIDFAMEKKFSLKEIEKLARGDNNFKKEMIAIFLEQIPDFIAQMKKFLEEKKMEELAKTAHTAKSSVLVFEMSETEKDLKTIQFLAEKGEIKKAGTLILKVEKDLLEVHEELLKLVKKL